MTRAHAITASTVVTTPKSPNAIRPIDWPGENPIPRNPAEKPPLKWRSPGPKAIQSNVTANAVIRSAERIERDLAHCAGNAIKTPAKKNMRAAGKTIKSSGFGC